MLKLKHKVIAVAILAIPAALASAQSATFRVVVNPEDSGYIGPVAQEDTTAAPAGVAGSSFAQRMGQGGSKRSSSFLAPLGLHLGRRI